MTAPGLPTLPKRIGSVLHSIRFRLVLWYTVILALVLVAFSMFIFINRRTTSWVNRNSAWSAR